jgi:cysteine desulfurase
VVEQSREAIAAAVGVSPLEVVFTATGTEADNLAVKGLWWARRTLDPRRRRILVSRVEHHAVLAPVAWLAEHEAAEVDWLEVDAQGRVDPAAVEASLRAGPDDVALVAVMWANNEVGTVQQIGPIAEACRAARVPLHVDAVGALGAVPVDAAGLSTMALSAHKVGGPLGAGALVVRQGPDPVPVIHGGGQERRMRSGTLDVPAIAGFAAAAVQAVADLPASSRRVAHLRDSLVAAVRSAAPDAVLNGATAGPGRLPGNAHLTFPGCEGEALLMLLDAAGVEVSTGSACASGVAEPSHVLIAMGVAPALARCSLRMSLGLASTPGDVEALVAALPPALERARRAGRLRPGLGAARAGLGAERAGVA